MCFWKTFKTPSVTYVTREDTGLTARDIVPQTTAEEPESPLYGGSSDDDTIKKQKGKASLKITRSPISSSYNPITM